MSPRHDRDVGRRAAREVGDEIAVDFDREHRRAGRRERQRQGAGARPDFEEHVTRRRPRSRPRLSAPTPARESAARIASAADDARYCFGSAFLVVRLVIVIVVRIAPPVALFDLLDLLFGEPEVVADLVDQRLADRDDDVVFVLARVFDRSLKERDLVGQHVAVRPLALGQRRALIEPEQRVGRLDLDLGQLLGRRLVFDHDGDVLHRVPKSLRDRLERFVDQLLERPLASLVLCLLGLARRFLALAIWPLGPAFGPSRR